MDQKFADTEDYDDDRVPTPPGKRRVAFRGQYIFVTDDDEEYSEDDGKSKAGENESRKTWFWTTGLKYSLIIKNYPHDEILEWCRLQSLGWRWKVARQGTNRKRKAIQK